MITKYVVYVYCMQGCIACITRNIFVCLLLYVFVTLSK